MMRTIPFPNADRALRLAWVVDVDAALSEAEGYLQAVCPIGRRVELTVDIAQVRASLAVELGLLIGERR
jgi:hypothetical protein